jgi:hypothetical protein
MRAVIFPSIVYECDRQKGNNVAFLLKRRAANLHSSPRFTSVRLVCLQCHHRDPFGLGTTQYDPIDRSRTLCGALDRYIFFPTVSYAVICYGPMASLYRRGNRIWMNFRDAEGNWRNRSTGYRWNNVIEMRHAKKACAEQTLKERVSAKGLSGSWNWVAQWIESSWDGLTLRRYHQAWQPLAGYLKEAPVSGPSNLSRDHCLAYVNWRENRGGGRNSAVLELRFLGQVVDEAIRRGICEKNPARNLRIKKVPAKEKSVWSDAELSTVDTALATMADKYGWMRVSFLLGRFQASRLGQSVVPLSAIDLQRNVIHWPSIGHEGWQSVLSANRGRVKADTGRYRRTPTDPRTQGHGRLAAITVFGMAQVSRLAWTAAPVAPWLTRQLGFSCGYGWDTGSCSATVLKPFEYGSSQSVSQAVHG